jgi:hypothetical protein
MDHVALSASHIFYTWRKWPKTNKLKLFGIFFSWNPEASILFVCRICSRMFTFLRMICFCYLPNKIRSKKGGLSKYKDRHTSYDLKNEKETTKILCNIAKWFTEILCFIMSLREQRTIPSQPLCSSQFTVHCLSLPLKKIYQKMTIQNLSVLNVRCGNCALFWDPPFLSCSLLSLSLYLNVLQIFCFSYLWTYDLYSPVHNAFLAGKSITRALGRGLGPGSRDFFGPC